MEEKEWKSVESAPLSLTVKVKEANGVVREGFFNGSDGWYGRTMHHIYNKMEVPVGWMELEVEHEAQ